MLQMKIKQ